MLRTIKKLRFTPNSLSSSTQTSFLSFGKSGIRNFGAAFAENSPGNSNAESELNLRITD